MTHGLTHSINHIIHTQRHQHIANKDNTMHQINIFVFPWSCTMEFQTRNACSNLTLELEPPSAIWHPNTIWQANSSQSFPDLQSANKCSNVDMCAFASSLFMLSFKISLFTWHQMKHNTKHDYKLMMFETQIKCHLLHDLVMAIVASMFLSPQKHKVLLQCARMHKATKRSWKTAHDYKLVMFETQTKCHLLHDLVTANVLLF